MFSSNSLGTFSIPFQMDITLTHSILKFLASDRVINGILRFLAINFELPKHT